MSEVKSGKEVATALRAANFCCELLGYGYLSEHVVRTFANGCGDSRIAASVSGRTDRDVKIAVIVDEMCWNLARPKEYNLVWVRLSINAEILNLDAPLSPTEKMHSVVLKYTMQRGLVVDSITLELVRGVA